MNGWYIVFLVINIALSIGLIFWNRALHAHIQKLHQKKEQLEKITLDDIGDIMRHHEQGIAKLESGVGQIREELEYIHQRVDRTIQHTSVLRFNPFRDTGGDQSFAAALLDHRGDGLVISSLHSRTGTRVYAKPIEAGASRFELTDEEMNALARASRAEAPTGASTGEEETQPVDQAVA